MLSVLWLNKRQPYWTRLEALLNDVQRQGLKALNRSELRELGLLYRQTATDLATVRGDIASVQLSRYLNQLLGRAHNAIYSGQKKSVVGIGRFYLGEYPRVFRQLFPYTAMATAIFAAGAAIGMLLTLSHPEFMRAFLGPHMIETIEKREMWTHSILSVKPQASSAIMTNNLAVGFTTFAFGITAGIGTLYMLFFNGLMMGVIGVACWLSDMNVQLWSFIAPHGVLELPAIFIAGGAGLRLAQGLLFPGILPRRDSLALAGGEAVRLLVGTIPMLIIAGFIEAFISPSGLPAGMKFSVAAAILTLLIVYLRSGGVSRAS